MEGSNMKRIAILSIAAAVVLVAGTAGISLAGSSSPEFGRDATWPAILLGDAGSDYNESIGTGSMDSSESVESPAVEDKPETVSPALPESGSDEAIGTGSLPSGSGESPGYDGPPRSDIDLP